MFEELRELSTARKEEVAKGKALQKMAKALDAEGIRMAREKLNHVVPFPEPSPELVAILKDLEKSRDAVIRACSVPGAFVKPTQPD